MTQWNRLLDSEVKALVRNKRTVRSPGADGESLSLYLEGPGTRFAKGESRHLERLKRDLNSGKYRPRPVFEKEFPKKNGGLRRVYSLTSRDYLVSRAVGRGLRDMEPMFRPASPRDAVLELVSYLQPQATKPPQLGAVIRLDVKSYFDEIPEPKVSALFDRQGAREECVSIEEAMRRLSDARVWHEGIKVKERASVFAPQGFPHSAAIAQWYIASFLGQWAHTVQTRFSIELRVFRFVDDILILFPGKIGRLKMELCYWSLVLLFKRKGLSLHSRGSTGKTLVTPLDSDRFLDFRFLGLSLRSTPDRNLRVSLPESVVKSRKTFIWRQFNRYFGANLHPRISKLRFSQRVNLLKYKILRDSAGCRYKGKGRGFVNYWAISQDASSFVLLDNFVYKCCRSFGVMKSGQPLVESQYYLSFKKIKTKGFRESVMFNYDTMDRKRRISILVGQFGFSLNYLRGLNSEQLSNVWHSTLRGDLIGIPAGGYDYVP